MRLAARLYSIERRLNPRKPIETGVLEMHFPGAWPACLQTRYDVNYERCTEHEDCGFTIGRTGGNLHRVIIFDGPWVDAPPLG